MVGMIRLVYMDKPMAGARPMLRVELVVSSQPWVLRIFPLHRLKHIWLGWPLKPTQCRIYAHPHLSRWPKLSRVAEKTGALPLMG